MIPIGPAPVISTSSPRTLNFRAVWTAFPRGSKQLRTSRGMFGLHFQIFPLGTLMYSAKAPGLLTPMPLVSLQRWRRPARQFLHLPQTICPSAETRSPISTSCTSLPIAATSPTNSCPVTKGTGTVRCDHSSQLYICISVPQMDVFLTFIRTSCIPISGTGTSSIQMPGSAYFLTNAFMKKPP